MAYQAKRSRKVIEEFELVNENNEVEECLRVELDADAMIEKLRKKYMNLLKAQENAAKIQLNNNDNECIQNAYNALGIAVSDMIEAVFGEEDTKVILKFYDNRYTEMAKEVLPFISSVVLPKVEAIAKQNKKELLSRFNRKQKRTLLRGLR